MRVRLQKFSVNDHIYVPGVLGAVRLIIALPALPKENTSVPLAPLRETLNDPFGRPCVKEKRIGSPGYIVPEVARLDRKSGHTFCATDMLLGVPSLNVILYVNVPGCEWFEFPSNVPLAGIVNDTVPGL